MVMDDGNVVMMGRLRPTEEVLESMQVAGGDPVVELTLRCRQLERMVDYYRDALAGALAGAFRESAELQREIDVLRGRLFVLHGE